ncbi:hypothetical protein FB45DRAFT_326391 [Roridomyces roridus]|uniref:Uncharacterized protein n=1 Tax=Roridomyces roridus TaxID=1738132 RepID=A0AAD7B5K2_9AGAR|nr:hypothetical protein FB45DRAFT_326391 [Roridomyces roridus]
MLIPGHMSMGENLPVGRFCHEQKLSVEIRNRMLSNGVQYTRAFDYISLHQLEMMGLKCGEIAEMRAAVAQWAVMPQ